MKTIKSKRIGKKRLMEIASGRVAVAEVVRWYPRAKEFRTKYAAKVRGVLLKTSRGVFFSTKDRAMAAGRATLMELRRKLGVFPV